MSKRPGTHPSHGGIELTQSQGGACRRPEYGLFLDDSGPECQRFTLSIHEGIESVSHGGTACPSGEERCGE